MFRNQLYQLSYFVLINDEPLNSAMVAPPTFDELSGISIDGPRGTYLLFEDVVPPVWRMRHAMFLFIDIDGISVDFQGQFETALQTVWNGIDSGKFRLFIWT